MMRRYALWRRLPRSAGVVGVLAGVAVAASVGVPLAASASSHGGDPHARSAAARGAVYGGRTAQGWPVVIELNTSRRGVVQAVIGLRLTCTSGATANLPDRYLNIRVKRRKFRASFGPETVRLPDGTTADFQGSISGRLNRARSRVSGRWNLQFTSYDTAGAVTDTCDSGSVSWTAKQ